MSEISEFLTLVAIKKPQDGNAEQVYRWASDLDPENQAAWNARGRILLARRRNHEALDCFERAFAIERAAPIVVNAATALWRTGDWQGAIERCDEALGIDPAFIPAYVEKSAIYQSRGDDETALRIIEAGLARSPGDHDLLFGRSMIRLANGDFAGGWADYEHRQARRELAEKLDNISEWTGQDLNGKKLLVCGEQGCGDQIMFARFLPEFNLGNVFFFTQPDLVRLFEISGLGCEFVTSDRELLALDVDYWIGLASLASRAQSVESPYLAPRRADVDRFAALVPRNRLLRVGLCWAGNPKHRWDDLRSLAFEQLGPILDVVGAAFYSLQAGEPAEQNDGRATDLLSYAHDFADTAAAIANMDLVISVDTAVLHLAGAMGKPAWGLLHKPEDWRWGKESRATDWYSSVTLYRQQDIGEWAAVIARMACDLTDYAARNTSAELDEGPRHWHVGTAPTHRGPLLYYKNDHYIGRALDLYGEYSDSEASLLADVLTPGDTVVEAGANIGALTLPILHEVGSAGCVISFEPQAAYYNLLEGNVGQFPQMILRRQALGNCCEPIVLKAVETERIHAPGWEANGREFIVAQITVDSLALPRLDLLKIDVDGQELEILQGAEETVARTRPLIYVENDKPARYPDLLPWLIRHGYKVWQHFAPLYNPENFAGYKANVFGKIVSAMLLCVPQERFLDQKIIDRHGLQRVRLTHAGA